MEMNIHVFCNVLFKVSQCANYIIPECPLEICLAVISYQTYNNYSNKIIIILLLHNKLAQISCIAKHSTIHNHRDYMVLR